MSGLSLACAGKCAEKGHTLGRKERKKKESDPKNNNNNNRKKDVGNSPKLVSVRKN